MININYNKNINSILILIVLTNIEYLNKKLKFLLV